LGVNHFVHPASRQGVDENGDVEVNIGRCHPEWWLGGVASSSARCRSYQRREAEDDASLLTVGPTTYRIGIQAGPLGGLACWASAR
jgi:hypothetical protein